MLTASDFRIVDVFEDQDEADLAWLAETAEEATFAAGTKPFRRGDPAEAMFIMLEGAFQITTFTGGQATPFGTVRAGEISGLLPFSRMETFIGEGTVIDDCRMALLPRAQFWPMLERMPEVGKRLVSTMTDRVRESSRVDQQREKMLALGKLSAGLAHELNNPAAAIQRSASELGARFAGLVPLVSRLAGHGLSPTQLEGARAAVQTCTAPGPGAQSALDRSAKEDALADWLDDHEVPDAYVLAEVLAEEGVTPTALDRLAAEVPPAALTDVVLWIEKAQAVDRLVADVQRSGQRISELVAAVKGYSHRDQAPARQTTPLAAGIEQTLTMLGHSIRQKHLTVEMDLAEAPDTVWAFPGELNQVWTNLLDNAIDAAPEGGTLRIAGRREGGLACVEIQDDGAGMPADVAARIWEPFYTTKAPGEGTGLGLDMVQRIVRQHGGRVEVESAPGRTVFTVCLPIEATSA